MWLSRKDDNVLHQQAGASGKKNLSSGIRPGTGTVFQEIMTTTRGNEMSSTPSILFGRESG
jgi:hypothetical protein